MVEKDFASVSIALTRPGLGNGTNSRAVSTVKSLGLSCVSESSGWCMAQKSDRSCWIMAS